MKYLLTILLALWAFIGFSQVKNYTIEGTKWVKTPMLILGDDTIEIKEVGDTLLTTEKWRILSALIKSGYDSSRFNVSDGYIYHYISSDVSDSTDMDGRYKLLTDSSYNAAYGEITVTSTNISANYPLVFDTTTYWLNIYAYYLDTIGSDVFEVSNGVYNIEKTTTGFSCEVQNAMGFLRYLAVDSVSLECLEGYTETDLTYVADSGDIKLSIREIVGDTSGWNAKVPFTGATQDLYLGENNLFAKNIIKFNPAVINYCALGNSITFAGGNGYAEKIDSMLDFKSFVNLAVNSTTAMPLDDRPRLYSQVVNIPDSANLITVMIGVNDFDNSNYIGDVDSILLLPFSSLDTTRSFADAYRFNMQYIKDSFPDANIFAINILKTTRNGVYDLNQYRSVISKICNYLSIPVINADKEAGLTESSHYLSDEVHPNSLGQNRLASYIATKIITNSGNSQIFESDYSNKTLLDNYLMKYSNGIYSNSIAYDTGDKFGIGTTAPLTQLDILTTNDVSGGIRMQSTLSDDTTKNARIKIGQYNNEEEPVTMMMASTASSENILFIGGGTAVENAMTEIKFYTASTPNTLRGMANMTINNIGNVGIGTSGPTNILSLGNSADRKFWIENTDTDVVGRALTVSAGSTVAGTSVSNVTGGNLILQSGLGTGTGASTISFQTGTTLTTGTTLQTMSTKMTILGNGNVGISTINPLSKLAVIGSAATNLNLFNFTNSDVNKIRTTIATTTDTSSFHLSSSVTGNLTLRLVDKVGSTQLQSDSTLFTVPKLKTTPITAALTDGTPTDTEIDTATGLTPATAGAGWECWIKDNDGAGLVYRVVSDGSGWYWFVTTLAL
jgi:lysophospholipase L1-like esterase